jgi:hypothetical protein
VDTYIFGVLLTSELEMSMTYTIAYVNADGTVASTTTFTVAEATLFFALSQAKAGEAFLATPGTLITIKQN